MKKIGFLVLCIVLSVVGCSDKGFNDSEETIQYFFDAYTDIYEGKNRDIESVCDLTFYGTEKAYCQDLLEEAKEETDMSGETYSMSFTITDIETTLLSDTQKVYYGFDEGLVIYEAYVSWREDAIWSQGDTLSSDTLSDEFYMVLIDDHYYIIALG